jgi:hypothetical protein
MKQARRRERDVMANGCWHERTRIVITAGAAEPDAPRDLHPRRMRRAERAGAVVRTTKQYLLHHGFPGRLSTAGNVAFPFTPPDLSYGTAYRFNVYHIMGSRRANSSSRPEVGWRKCGRYQAARYDELVDRDAAALRALPRRGDGARKVGFAGFTPGGSRIRTIGPAEGAWRRRGVGSRSRRFFPLTGNPAKSR